MDLLQGAKSIRLRGHHDKYLLADEDEEHVSQERSGSTRRARWTVEFIDGHPVIRLKSCYGKYLTASSEPFLLGMTGSKVLQTVPRRLDSSVEWEPIRDGMQIKLKTRYGNFLRANGGLPPWRNSVTHDIPHRHHDWVLWEVEIVEVQAPAQAPVELDNSSMATSPDSSPKFSKQESSSFYIDPPKSEGRSIHYVIADDSRDYDDGEEFTLNFKGASVEELTQKLMEETEMPDIIVCSRNPLNGKLYPLRLQLPPNNTTMRVVLVPSSSKLAKSFSKTENHQ